MKSPAIILIALFSIFPSAHSSTAQTADRIWRIGLLDAGSPIQSRKASWRNFQSRTRELGYVEGQNTAFEWRWGHGDQKQLVKVARELADSKVDVIVTVATPAVFAAHRATKTIPIVTAVASGGAVIPSLVKSLVRPGGNVTGMLSFGQFLTVKRLEVAKELVPTASRIALLGAKNHPGFAVAARATKAGAKTLGVTIIEIGISSRDELKAAFINIKKERADAVIVAPGALMGSLRAQLAELSKKARIPIILPDRRYAEAGGLVGFGSNFPELFRGAAVYVDKVLKGGNPAEIPAEQQRRFELVVNLKTAVAVGIKIPRSVLMRADDIIQ